MSNETKMKKSLSPLNVWSLALGSIIGWGAFVMPGDLFLKTAGPLGTAIGLLLGGLIMIVIAISYGYLVEKFPVAGGEFAFTLKGFNRKHAFVCAWFLGLSYLSVVPLNATALGLIGRYMFPGIMQQGYLYSIAGWDVYLGEVAFASLAIILFAVTSIRGMEVSGKLQTIMSISLVSSIVIIFGVAISSDISSVDHLKPFFSPDVPPLKGILSIVAIAPWIYVGFDAIPQAAEEFNFPAKRAMMIMIVSIILGTFMYIAINTVTAIVYPWHNFINSSPFWATGQSVEILMGRVGLLLLGLALTSAILAGLIGFYMASSRLLVALSRSKALPAWFGKIDSKYQTPKNAILFVMVLSLIAPWFGRQVLLWVVDMAAIGAAIGYFYTSASAYRLIKKDKGSPFKLFTSALGSVFSIGFILMFIIPGMPSYLTLPSRVALIIWSILGIIFYFISSKSYLSLSDEALDDLVLSKH